MAFGPAHQTGGSNAGIGFIYPQPFVSAVIAETYFLMLKYHRSASSSPYDPTPAPPKMSSQKPTNGHQARPEGDEEMPRYPPWVQTPLGNPIDPATQHNTQSQQKQPQFPAGGHPLYRSQTPVTQQHGRSLTSLEQYALFPAPVRAATPGPVVTAPSRNYTTPPTDFFSISPTSRAFEFPLVNSGPPSDTQSSGPSSSSTTSSTKKHSCHLCAVSFERRYDLKRHMHTHAEQKEFECARCQKALARNDSLQRHQAV
ncbi:hypothetical protein FRC17_004276, partial [Serendipita sp. 399]